MGLRDASASKNIRFGRGWLPLPGKVQIKDKVLGGAGTSEGGGGYLEGQRSGSTLKYPLLPEVPDRVAPPSTGFFLRPQVGFGSV